MTDDIDTRPGTLLVYVIHEKLQIRAYMAEVEGSGGLWFALERGKMHKNLYSVNDKLKEDSKFITFFTVVQ